MMRWPRFSHLRWWSVPLWVGLLVVGTLLLVGLLVVGLIVAGKGPHVSWLIERRMNPLLFERPAVAVAPLEADVPQDWRRYRIGPLEIGLPPNRVREVRVWGEDTALSGVMIDFGENGRELFVALPRDASAEMDAWRKQWAATAPIPTKESLGRIQVSLYEASADDFRWSLSAEEVRQLRWRIGMKFFVTSDAMRVETVFAERLEALLLVRARGAFFEWNSTDERAGGMLVFDQQPGAGDLSWVRPICASLEFTGEPYPEKVPKETLEQIADELRGQLHIELTAE